MIKRGCLRIWWDSSQRRTPLKVNRNWRYDQWCALCADSPVELLGSDQWDCFFDVYGKVVCKLSRWRKSPVLLSTHLILWQFINGNDRHGSPKSTASFSEILTVNLWCFLVSNGTQWRFPDGSERTAWCVWHRAGSFSSIYSQSLKEKEKKEKSTPNNLPSLVISSVTSYNQWIPEEKFEFLWLPFRTCNQSETFLMSSIVNLSRWFLGLIRTRWAWGNEEVG